MLEILYAPAVDTLVPWSDCNSIERWHYDRVFAELVRSRPSLDWQFIVTELVEDLPKVGARVVVILKSDERSRPPAYTGAVRALFRNYHSPDSSSESRNVFPLPLPSLISAPPVLRPTPSRRLDVAFMGNVRDRRWDFVANFAELQASRRDLRIAFTPTERFRGGLSAVEYSQTLADSKIALCPAGGAVETFRFTEALQHGCVVIAERQPRQPFYLAAEYHPVTDWRMLGPLVGHLLPLEKESRIPPDAANRAISHWERAFSPEAVAHYVLDTLEGL